MEAISEEGTTPNTKLYFLHQKNELGEASWLLVELSSKDTRNFTIFDEENKIYYNNARPVSLRN